jgi:hypothetical protein
MGSRGLKYGDLVDELLHLAFERKANASLAKGSFQR